MSTTLHDTRPAGAPAQVRPPTVGVSWLAVMLLLVVLAAAASVALGTRMVGWHDVIGGLSGGEDSIAEAAVAKRIPRTILALIVGAALGVAGAVMQGVTRNPLADPGILGVTSGAALFVVSGIAFFSLSSQLGFLWVAIVGAGVSAAFVYAMGSLGHGGPTPLKLALAGAATSASFTCLTSAILLPRIDVMTVFRFWQIGGVGGANYDKITLAAPFFLVGALVCLASARGLNSLALGDDVAAGLGIRVGRTRLVAAAGAIVLCGAATAVAGPIAFVGLVVPHACRILVGADHRWLVPLSALAGATLLTASDVVGRIIARPAEIDVGIIVAFVGAPVFIALVRRLKVRAL
ncbi:MAG TPA: iron ABC transporter permease [Nocardioidaceae bacterium]|nr:iron ABC transporter permease [Nocardioidaceae bacterium]